MERLTIARDVWSYGRCDDPQLVQPGCPGWPRWTSAVGFRVSPCRITLESPQDDAKTRCARPWIKTITVLCNIAGTLK
jgi:hypothetical protein